MQFAIYEIMLYGLYPFSWFIPFSIYCKIIISCYQLFFSLKKFAFIVAACVKCKEYIHVTDEFEFQKWCKREREWEECERDETKRKAKTNASQEYLELKIRIIKIVATLLFSICVAVRFMMPFFSHTIQVLKDLPLCSLLLHCFCSNDDKTSIPNHHLPLICTKMLCTKMLSYYYYYFNSRWKEILVLINI